jgi:hypothetical protein
MQGTTVAMGSEQYGLGWHIRTDVKGRRHVLHGGAHVGFECHLEMIPDEKLCVAVLANKDVKWPGYRVCLDVADQALAAVLRCPVADVQPKGGHALGEASKDSAGLPGKLAGTWHGTVYTHERKIKVTLSFLSDGGVEARLGDQRTARIENARFEHATFTGRMSGDIGTPEAKRRPHELEWEVTQRRENELSGILYAVGLLPVDARPARGLRLAHWVELRRDQ